MSDSPTTRPTDPHGPASTPDAMLAEIVTAASFDRRSPADVAFSGADPVLASAFPIGSAGAAAIGATGLAAADLWELRTGRRQDVAVDVPRSALAMAGTAHTALLDRESPALWEKMSGLYQAGDGRWIQLHCNFTHHREGTAAVLGCAPEREAAAAAIAERGGLELETALTEAGMAASLSRTADEWDAHPHSAVVDARPLIEIERIGDSAAVPFKADGDQPLSGIRALDLTRVLAGPTCGRTLAEHGADVMRISGPHLPSVDACVLDTGHGKLAAFVDLRETEEVATLRSLVEHADIFTQGYRPGTLADRGFSPEQLADIRPGIIYVSLSAYGNDGPWGGKRGYDSLVQGVTGMTIEQGGEQTPTHLPASLLDYASGYLMAFGAMTALGRRAREGGSYHVQVSLVRVAHWVKQLARVERPDEATASANIAAAAERATMISDTPFGRVQHLAPIVELSETPPRWSRPVVPLGTHPPAWT